jgi:acylphosphatase
VTGPEPGAAGRPGGSGGPTGPGRSVGPHGADGVGGFGDPSARLTAWVEGRVQGVGFRWWARARALEFGLTGVAENLADGRVKVVAEGPKLRCEDLLALLESGQTPGRVRRVITRWGPATGSLAGFVER